MSNGETLEPNEIIQGAFGEARVVPSSDDLPVLPYGFTSFLAVSPERPSIYCEPCNMLFDKYKDAVCHFAGYCWTCKTLCLNEHMRNCMNEKCKEQWAMNHVHTSQSVDPVSGLVGRDYLQTYLRSGGGHGERAEVAMLNAHTLETMPGSRVSNERMQEQWKTSAPQGWNGGTAATCVCVIFPRLVSVRGIWGGVVSSRPKVVTVRNAVKAQRTPLGMRTLFGMQSVVLAHGRVCGQSDTEGG